MVTKRKALIGGQVWVVRQGSRKVGHIAKRIDVPMSVVASGYSLETVCGLPFRVGSNGKAGVWRFAVEPGDNVCATCWNTRAVEDLEAKSAKLGPAACPHGVTERDVDGAWRCAACPETLDYEPGNEAGMVALETMRQARGRVVGATLDGGIKVTGEPFLAKLRGIDAAGGRRTCALCGKLAVVKLGPELLAKQADATTHVCHPNLGGCNHGYGPPAAEFCA